MDEMRIVSKFTRGIISKAIKMVIRKKTGYNIDIQLNEAITTINDGSEPGGSSVTDATTSGEETESSDTSDYDALVNEVLDSISAQIDDIIGNYTSGDDKEGDDS